MEVLLKPLLTLVIVYGYPIIALLDLLSSTGAPLPMTAILLVAGSLAAAGLLNIYVLFTLIMICSIIGDILDYYVGRRFGPSAFEKLGKSNNSTARIKAYFLRWSGVSIFLSRWLFTPFSSIVSVIAGASNYKFHRYLIVDILGELFATTIFLTLGYMLGVNWSYMWDYLDGVPGIVTSVIVGCVFIVFGLKKLSCSRQNT